MDGNSTARRQDVDVWSDIEKFWSETIDENVAGALGTMTAKSQRGDRLGPYYQYSSQGRHPQICSTGTSSSTLSPSPQAVDEMDISIEPQLEPFLATKCS